MAAITKNRNFFKWPKLLYFKPEHIIMLIQYKFEPIMASNTAVLAI
jgi:hypothetical protein